ncbi:hypothetical protein [Magnetospirillum sp. 15-1]|nr:hypothetical protein [Magnetospirillum sp. 15-1]
MKALYGGREGNRATFTISHDGWRLGKALHLGYQRVGTARK